MNYGITRPTTNNMVKLSTLKAGDVFHWQGDSFEDCLAQKDDATFFMVIALPKVEEGRIACVSLDGKTVLVRDGVHMVNRATDCSLLFERLK